LTFLLSALADFLQFVVFVPSAYSIKLYPNTKQRNRFFVIISHGWLCLAWRCSLSTFAFALKCFYDWFWNIIETTFAFLNRRLACRHCSVWLVAVLTFYLCGFVTRFILPIVVCQKTLQRFVVYPKKTVVVFCGSISTGWISQHTQACSRYQLTLTTCWGLSNGLRPNVDVLPKAGHLYSSAWL
jgi:hypothetical protein